MKILVINCGSSSIKYRLFRETENDLENIAGGSVTDLGKESAAIVQQVGEKRYEKRLDRPDYTEGFEAIVGALLDREFGALKDISEIGAVGHRTVHGGSRFTGSVLIDDEVMAKLRECIPLAPLHNPANIMGVEQATRLLPHVPQAAVFDTAFHQSLPARAYMYPIPYSYYREHGLRRYGFHGTSCDYVSREAARLVGGELAALRMIVCHLGAGASITAILNGRSVDTSLGFSTVAGLMMSLRCGDIDPGLVLYLQREVGLTLAEVDRILHNESGLLGVSGLSGDLKKVLEAAERGDARCLLAVDMFTYRIKKYIGAFAAAMGGLDVVVFTGGIGENSAPIRSRSLENLEFLSIELDPVSNEATSNENRIVSRINSRVAVAVIPTNEELMIARETLTLIGITG